MRQISHFSHMEIQHSCGFLRFQGVENQARRISARTLRLEAGMVRAGLGAIVGNGALFNAAS